MRAVNEVGHGQASSVASVIPGTIPSSPLNVSLVRDGSQSLILSWSPPDDDGGLPITHYKYAELSSGGTFVSTGAGDSIRFTGLSNGALYGYQVRAVNDEGEGDCGHISSNFSCGFS